MHRMKCDACGKPVPKPTQKNAILCGNHRCEACGNTFDLNPERPRRCVGVKGLTQDMIERIRGAPA